MRRSFTTVLVTALVSACAGEPPLDDDARLSYLDPCTWSCSGPGLSLDDPVAQGARFLVSVDNWSRLPPYSATSSDASVIEVSTDELGIQGEAVGVGSAELLVLGPEDERLGAVELDVHEVGRLEVPGLAPGDRLLLMSDGELQLEVEVLDASGRALLGYGAVGYTTTGGVALTSARDLADEYESTGGVRLPFWEQVRVQGIELGVSPVEARAGDASFGFEVEVVSADAVADLDLQRHCSWFGVCRTWAHAYTADGTEIFGPTCHWTVEPADAEHGVEVTPSHVRLATEEDESVRVTCEINGLQSSAYL